MPETKMPATSKGAGPTAHRIVLGGKLRKLREKAGLSRSQAGQLIRGSESKISRLELGRLSFKERDVADLLAAYGVADSGEHAYLMDLVRRSNQQGWWHPYNDVATKGFDEYLGLEEAASRIKIYELQFVPGLLQTADYARAVFRRHIPQLTDLDIERKVAVRMRRKLLLTHEDGPRVNAVVDESVLYRQIESPELLKDQLTQLLDVMQLPTVSLTVVPYRRGGRSLETDFSLLEFDHGGLPDQVYLEHLRTALYVEKPDEVASYQELFNSLLADSEGAEDSRLLIEKARSTLCSV